MARLWWVLGVVLVVAGVMVVLATPSAPTDYGWFAYTPLSEDPGFEFGGVVGDGATVWVAQGQLIGATVTALGLVVVASAVGYRLGRRRAAVT